MDKSGDSSVKRRRLDAPSDKPPLSAFAARKAQQSAKSNRQINQHRDSNPRILDLSIEEEHLTASKVLLVSDDPEPRTTKPSKDELALFESSRLSFNHEDSQESRLESRAESIDIVLEKPSIGLSNFKPDKNNIKKLAGDVLSLHLAPGERLVILGVYEISVRKGQVTLKGSTLLPSEIYYRVFASSSHALPVIRCLGTDVNGADLRLRPCESGLRSLHSLSPLFGKLWNDYHGPLGPKFPQFNVKHMRNTFQILFSSKDGPSKAFLQPLISPPPWNEMVAKCSVPLPTRARIIMLCGPKSSGKSTFAKLLVNRLLAVSVEDSKATNNRNAKVAFLDLDPGQPEYSAPGQLSLVYVQDPNFGPPFAHPMPASQSKVIRSHFLGAVSPALDPDLYMACALDLFTHYRNQLSRSQNCSLVINTPGWVLGTGLEILTDLIAKVTPTEVIYMSKEGPPEVVDALSDVNSSVSVFTLPSQVSEFTTRTAAHLRTMQYMSYFHLSQPDQKGLSWNPRPLTSMPPWEIRYAGENPGILGVMCYGEQPPASLLADTINGSLVAVVVIDDMTAIPGWRDASNNHKYPAEADGDIEDGDSTKNDSGAQPLEYPLILNTPEEIPYFNPLNAITLDPSKSHNIGLALVRGVDTERRRIQVLTPISPREIEEINEAEKSIVLVSGKLDTPGWAYIEELTQKMALEKSKKSIMAGGNERDVDVDDSDESDYDEESKVGNKGKAGMQERSLGVGFEDAPWIEKLEGSQGRGIGSRVWRVRRDLGRADGGE